MFGAHSKLPRIVTREGAWAQDMPAPRPRMDLVDSSRGYVLEGGGVRGVTDWYRGLVVSAPYSRGLDGALPFYRRGGSLRGER